MIEELDELDYKIIDMLQKDPSLTHSAIARDLDRSQPAIGARVKKLEKLGYLRTQMGVDFKDVSHLTLVRLDLETSRANDMIELGKFCPYVINTMKMSGEENISILLAASDERRLENVIDRHYRQKPYVDRIKICRMIECGEKLVLPMDFLAETMPPGADPCDYNPICRKARAAANARTPEEINLF